MLHTASELRAAGRADLSGRWSEAAMLTFVYVIIVSIFGGGVGSAANLMVPGISGVISLLLLPMAWGFNVTFLANRRHEDQDPFDIGHLLDGYRDFSRIFCTELLRNVYTLLWSLLLVIPGIIKALSYAMTPFILRDRPDLKNNGAIELSMAMMQGHKADLFWLYLTFIGWGVLCVLSLGIGYFWLLPYMNSTMVNFYEEVRQEFENGGVMNGGFTSGDNYQK